MVRTFLARRRRGGPLALVIVVALGAAAGVARCTLGFDPATLPAAPAPDGGAPPGCSTDGDCTLANATPVCNAGVCAVSHCNANYGDCNGIASDGCETSTRSDPMNCGGCSAINPDYACAPHENARAVCTGGVCTLACAGAQYADCDGNATNGCEVDLLSADNCGRCGRVCGPPLANCARVADGGIGCTMGCGRETACSGATDAGRTCVDLATNASHCGMCDTPCPSGASCVAGACGPCPTGETVCGPNCVNLATDRSNCGVCGAACTSGLACCRGHCQVSALCTTP